MSLTRLDCFFYRGLRTSDDTSSFVALNPRVQPGEIVIAGSCAARESLGSQVACKLSLQHFVSGVFDALSESDLELGDEQNKELCLKVLETAFKNANSSVYNFGHKLAAGGRMAATLLGMVIEEGNIAIGRVGQGSAYLARKGELFPFFEVTETEEVSSDSLVGAQSMVSVELASVPISGGDLLFVFSRELETKQERELLSCLEELSGTLDDMMFGKHATYSGTETERQASPCHEIASALFGPGEELEFAIMVVVGPDTIYLEEAA